MACTQNSCLAQPSPSPGGEEDTLQNVLFQPGTLWMCTGDALDFEVALACNIQGDRCLSFSRCAFSVSADGHGEGPRYP